MVCLYGCSTITFSRGIKHDKRESGLTTVIILQLKLDLGLTVTSASQGQRSHHIVEKRRLQLENSDRFLDIHEVIRH